MEQEIFVGTVIWFDRGFGFIAREEPQPDMFVHYSDIKMEGFKSLKKEQKVSFTLGVNHRGQPKATNVMILE